MKSSQNLVQSYEKGRLTRDGLFLNLLSLSRKRDLAAVLASLSPELLAQLQAPISAAGKIIKPRTAVMVSGR
jgi:hypothetical protein